MDLEEEKGKLSVSTILTWIPVMLLVGLGILVNFTGDDWFSGPQRSESLREPFDPANQKYPSRSAQVPTKTPRVVFDKSEEELFHDLVAATAFAGLRLSDFEHIQEIDVLNTRWSEFSIPIIVDYLDREFARESWVRDTSARLAEMRPIAARLEEVISLLPESTYKVKIAGENLRLRKKGLELFTSLHDSVITDNIEQQNQCAVDLGMLGEEQNKFAILVLQEVEKADLLSPEVVNHLGHRAERLLRLLK